MSKNALGTGPASATPRGKAALIGVTPPAEDEAAKMTQRQVFVCDEAFKERIRNASFHLKVKASDICREAVDSYLKQRGY